MTLREYMKTVPEDARIYVGASVAFLTGGNKDQVVRQLDKMSEENAALSRDQFMWLKERQKTATGREAKKIEKQIASFKPFVHFLDREIRDVYDRETEQATNILIEGDERGYLWTVEPVGTQIINDANLTDLVGKMLRMVVDDYKTELRAEYDKLSSLYSELQDVHRSAEKFEKYFHTEATYFTSIDPDYFIGQTAKMLAEELRREQEMRKEMPKANDR